jgi:hypothetical protein
MSKFKLDLLACWLADAGRAREKGHAGGNMLADQCWAWFSGKGVKE